MKDGFVKVAAVTPKIKVADPVFNADVILQEMNAAYEKGAKIIVFPQLCLTGSTCGDLFFQDTLLEASKEQLLRLVRSSEGKDALVFVGLPWEKDGRIYNVAAAIQDGTCLGFVPQQATSLQGMNRYFAPGNQEVCLVMFDEEEIPFGNNLLFQCDTVKGLVAAVEMGEDASLAMSPAITHARMGATVIVNMSAQPQLAGAEDVNAMMIGAKSGNLQAAYIYANAGEGESTQDYVFAGGNLIAENGKVLATQTPFECGFLLTDIDVQKILHERRKKNVLGTEPADNYLVAPFALEVGETKLNRAFAVNPFVPETEAAQKKRWEELFMTQVHGLKKRYEHIGAKTAVLGISGGLDSTLALLVTVKTFDLLGLDRKDIHTITMPCFGTTDRTYNNACLMCKAFGTSLKEIDIKKSVLSHFEDIGQDVNNRDVTYENSQARERTQILMDIANQVNGLVIGTGDMSELALGWATYNGDHMSMYGVNAGVPKTLVRHLVRYYSENCGDETLKNVLLDVLDTPVSPELLPPSEGEISQKTEDLVGPYELHDFFLYHMLRNGFASAKIFRLAKYVFEGEYEEEVIRKWLKTFYRRFFTQQFKRSCLADGPKVGSVGLSPRGDLNMPSDASMNVWMREIENM